MPNDEYIKRSDALQTVEDYFRKKEKSSSLFMAVETMCLCLIHKTPAADVEPKRMTGVWLEEEATDDGNWRYTCSVCGYADIQSRSAQVPFCWHCGSRMQKMDKDIEPPKEGPDAE